MSIGRDIAPGSPSAAEGWRFEQLTPTSRLFGANGLQTGPDGRIYIAQLAGSQISALDLASGRMEHVAEMGGDMIAPDDLAFSSRGDLYVTEPMNGRVSIRTKEGKTRVLRDDLPGANGITIHGDRLFVGECRTDGRLMEISLDGSELRTLTTGLPMPNAMQVGPDGYLYFPLMGANEIWRIHPDNGEAERVMADLYGPVALKIDAEGQIISTQMHSGEILRIDPRSGRKQVLAQIEEGLDNLTFVGERLFVSHFWNGQLTELLPDGQTRPLLPGGLNWPLGLTMDGDGTLYIADGFSLRKFEEGGPMKTIGIVFGHGFPVMMPRGLAPLGDGRLAITTMGGHVYTYLPGSPESVLIVDGLDQPYGIVASGEALLIAEQGAGRLVSVKPGHVDVLASGLERPTGVALAPDGSCLVSEAGAGRIVRVDGSGTETLLDGLRKPQGLAVRGDDLYIVDADAKSLIVYDLEHRTHEILATQLPVGVPPGVIPKTLKGIQPLLGPVGNFAGLAVARDGTVYISGDANGSVCALRPANRQ